MGSRSSRRSLAFASALTLFFGASAGSQAASILWWDSTPEYGGQAPDSLRQAMSDFLNSYGGGGVFTSTYVSSETSGTLATHLASNSYDVIVFDATSSTAKFNAADLEAVQWHYAGNSNLMLDGTLYIRSINLNATSAFPGINNSTGLMTVNQVHALAAQGGGIMIGTDHQGFQVDANQVLQAIVPQASFSGITFPSTDGVFYGSVLLDGLVPVAAVDIFNHWDSIDTQAIAPTGQFTDFLGNTIDLFSLVDVADFIGGPKFSYISASWNPGDDTTDVTDPNPGTGGDNGSVGVPEPATLAMLGIGLLGLGASRRRKQARS